MIKNLLFSAFAVGFIYCMIWIASRPRKKKAKVIEMDDTEKIYWK